MITDRPFDLIALDDIEALVTGQVPEQRRLEYKRALSLEQREGQVELLRDIVSFANTEGGLLLYGIREGDGDERGVAVGIDGIDGSFDEISRTVASLLRDNVDERITGVLQRPISLGDGRFVLLIKVPSSHLAPHMIANIRTSSARFFIRTNTSNEPMTARQIKEAARQNDTALERAAQRIAERVVILRAAGVERRNLPFADSERAHPNQAILHIVPLFPARGGWKYNDSGIAARLRSVTVFGYGDTYDTIEFTQHGAFLRLQGVRHVGFLRDGTLECQMFDVLEPIPGGSELVFFASDLERALEDAFAQAEQLSADGLLPTPALIQMHLLSVAGAPFQGTHATRSRGHRNVDGDVRTEGFILTDWSDGATVLRELLDHIWQAWGFGNCRHFGPEGELIRFDRYGQPIGRSV